MKPCFRHFLHGDIFRDRATGEEFMKCSRCLRMVEVVRTGYVFEDGRVAVREKIIYGVPDFLIRQGWLAWVPPPDPQELRGPKDGFHATG